MTLSTWFFHFSFSIAKEFYQQVFMRLLAFQKFSDITYDHPFSQENIRKHNSFFVLYRYIWQEYLRLSYFKFLTPKLQKLNRCKLLYLMQCPIKVRIHPNPHSSTPPFRRKEEAKQAAFILMKNSHFNRTPLKQKVFIWPILRQHKNYLEAIGPCKPSHLSTMKYTSITLLGLVEFFASDKAS